MKGAIEKLLQQIVSGSTEELEKIKEIFNIEYRGPEALKDYFDTVGQDLEQKAKELARQIESKMRSL